MARKIIDLTGQRFGELVVVAMSRKYTNSRIIQWECRCDCGNTKFVERSALRAGLTKSCGCLCREYWHRRKHELLMGMMSVQKAKAFLRKIDSLHMEVKADVKS